MTFLKQFTKSEMVFVIDGEVVEDSIVAKIVNNIKPEYKIGIDMKNVKTLNSSLFIKYLNKGIFKLYNLQNEILTYLSIIIRDGKLRSFMNFEDFKNNKRELVRRKFIIV